MRGGLALINHTPSLSCRGRRTREQRRKQRHQPPWRISLQFGPIPLRTQTDNQKETAPKTTHGVPQLHEALGLLRPRVWVKQATHSHRLASIRQTLVTVPDSTATR